MRQQRIDRLLNTPNAEDFFGDAWTAADYVNDVSLPNRFSDDNPYAQQFAYARNKQDLYALRNSAIEWEANRQSVLEQRAYDDPRAQLQRQRAAGLNPDLATSGGGSAVGAGSSAAMAQASPDIENAYNPLETANAVMSGISVATNAIASFTSSMTQAVEFVKSLKTFDDVVSAAGSQASLLKTAADVSANTKDAQILAANAAARSADVAAGIAEGTQDTTIQRQNTANQEYVYGSSLRQAQLDRQELNEYQAMASQYASIFDPSVTDPEIEAQLLEEGFHDGQIQALVPRIRHFLSHPEAKAKYDEAEVHANQAHARNLARPFKFFEQLEQNMAEIDMLQSSIDRSAAQFNNTVASIYYTDRNAAVQGDIQTTSLEVTSQSQDAQLQSIQYHQQAVKRDFDALNQQLVDLKAIEARIDQQISQLSSLPPTDANKEMLYALRLTKREIASRGQAQLSQIYNIAKQLEHSLALYQHSTYNGTVSPQTYSQKLKIQLSDYIWGSYNTQTSTIAEQIQNTIAQLIPLINTDR